MYTFFPFQMLSELAYVWKSSAISFLKTSVLFVDVIVGSMLILTCSSVNVSHFYSIGWCMVTCLTKSLKPSAALDGGTTFYK